MRIATVAIASLLALSAEAATKTTKAAKPKETSVKTTAFDRDALRIPHKKFVLKNGLTLLVHEDHSAPVVGVNLWYHVGSRNETRGKTGFAHLFEHFFFNGSENYPHGFREAMDDLGANNRNGTTSTDRTNFFETVPVSGLERTLYLEADRMGYLAGNISKEMLERERGVVQNEKRQGENQPYGRVFSEIVPTIYPYEHPYSWSTIGSMADLNAASLDDVKEWYRTYYGPNNAVIALAGDITAERALELVTKYFGAIPPGPPLRKAAEWIPKFDRNIRDTMEDRVPQARIYRIYRAPAWRHRDIQHLTLIARVLSGSKSSRLDKRLVYEKQLATSVDAGVWEKELSSDVLVTVTVKEGVEPAVAEKELDSVLAEFIASGPTSDEIERAKSRLMSDFVRDLERLGGFGGRSDVLAESMTFGGDPEFYLTRADWLMNADASDLRKTAKNWLDANHYTMLVEPFAKLTADTTAAAKVDRKVLPALGAAPEVTFPAMQRAALPNGMKVVLLERHSVPIVNFSLVLDAGYAADDATKAGTASLALELLDEGTKTRSGEAIADQLDLLGATLNTGSSLDQSLVRMSALPAKMRASLELLADVALNPAFPQEKVELERKLRIAQIAQEKVQPASLARRIVPKLLYGDHAYGRPLTGSGYAETVATITRDDLAKWHRTWFVPSQATLVVAGDTKLAALMPLVEATFGGWKGSAAPRKNIAPVARTKSGRIYLIDKKDAPQSMIIATHVSEPGGAADDLAIETAMRNFGGIATSRLNRNLRLDKHWSYGTSASLTDARGQRPFLVTAPVQTDKTKEAMLEVAKEIRGVAGERPVAGEEFASVMRSSTMRLPGRFETLAAVEAAAIQALNFGYPDDYFQKYAANVQALNERALADASKRFIRPDEVLWLVIGDLDKIEKGIRELGWGEIVRLDADGKVVER